ncbi:MAG: hypothetical protein ABW123_00285, partial [Cystobacter sp.]
MHRSTIPLSVCSLLSGLVLSACGGTTDAAPSVGDEALGTRESAVCYGAYVAGVTVDGVSTYAGTMGSGGSYSVAGGANAIRLEYYVDGALKYHEERLGNSGSWYYSYGGFGCGAHSFYVKSYPMVIDSNGTRSTCSSTPSTTSTYDASYACPTPPTASLSCTRSGAQITCTASATGGTGSYTPQWQEFYDGYANGWYTGTWSQTFYCNPIGSSSEPCLTPMAEEQAEEGTASMRPPPGCGYFETRQLQVKVVDSAGSESV